MLILCIIHELHILPEKIRISYQFIILQIYCQILIIYFVSIISCLNINFS